MGDGMLARVCELAFDVAKEGEAPSAMKSYLYLAQRPPRAYSVAQRALDEDAVFRDRVAERATIENVGEAGYLWLNRPEGWELHFAALTEVVEPVDAADRPPMPEPPGFATAPAPTVSSIESELAGLRGLVDRLADERQNVTSSVTQLEEELETRRSENLAMSTHLSVLRNELTAVQTTEASVSVQRDSALKRVEELEGQLAAMSAELDRTKTELSAEVVRVQTELSTELDQTKATLSGEITRVTAELESSNAERDGAKADLASVAVERDETAALLTKERSSSTEQVEALTANQTQLTADNTELAARVAVAEQARVDLEGQLEDVSSKWQATTRQLAVYSGVNDQLDAAVSERNQLRQQLSDARESLARVRSAVDTNHEQLSAELDEAERAVAAGPEASDDHGAPSSTDNIAIATTAPELIESNDAPINNDAAISNDDLIDDDVSGELAVEESVVDSNDTAELDELAFETPATHLANDRTGSDAQIDDFGVGAVRPIPVDDGADTQDAIAEDGAEAQEADIAEGSVEDVAETPEAETESADADERLLIDVPAELTGEIEVARHVVNTPDVVLLIDGDGAARLGWPHLDVVARRSALTNYLGQLTADTGAAADVVFERPVGGEDALPVSRAVRVRIADEPVGTSSLFASIVDGYPSEWPIAVVTDEPSISSRSTEMQVSHLSNGQLLDLFLYLSSSGE